MALPIQLEGPGEAEPADLCTASCSIAFKDNLIQHAFFSLIHAASDVAHDVDKDMWREGCAATS